MKPLKESFLLLFFIGLSFLSFSQRGKDGPRTINTANVIVNEYTRLTADASIGSTSITVAASGLNANARFAASLAPGDLIMIIQMQGATLSGSAVESPVGSGIFVGSPNNNSLGAVVSYNNCGNYEFCEVNAVPNATTITVDCGLLHNYTAAGRVQIVRVPRFSSLTINSPGNIYGTVWGAAYVGGVIAIEVQYNTVINVVAGITASAIGFRGGGLATNNPAGFGGSQFAGTSYTIGSNKGEGIGGYQSDYNSMGGQYGRGSAANAGGGGDCKNSGGGGGSNAGSLIGWDGLGNPDVSGGAGWVNAWNLEAPGFALHTSPGGGRGGYSTALNNQDATLIGPNNPLWGGDNRLANGGLGGRNLDYSTGKLFMGGGGGAGDRDNSTGGVGQAGGGLIYFMSYGNISGIGSVVSHGGNCLNAGGDGAGGAGGGGTIILNSVGPISGITASVNGGTGGNQMLVAGIIESEGPGGGGGAGYIAQSGGVFTQISNGGGSGTTNAGGLTEFPPNGATKGAAGLTNQVITHDTITTTNVTICNGNTATLTASIAGPIGATIYWYNTLVGGAPIATGTTFTTPPLFATTTYYAGFCPGTYRKPVVVTINGVAIVPGLISGPTPVCPNATGMVYLIPNTVGITYTWAVPAGATITSGQGTNQITVNFGAIAGTVSVVQSNICRSDPAITFLVTMTPLPVATAITGTTPVCPNATGIIFSVANVALSTYNWTVPAGAAITAGQGSNQITVDFAGTGGNVSVIQSNPCGVAPAVNFPLAIFPLPVTSAIAGVTPVCANQTGLVYSVTNVPGDTYAWIVPVGATITGGQGTNQITVTWGAASGTVSVVQTNVCGSGASVNYAVAVTPLPVTSSITGTTPVCPTAAGVVYSVTNVPGDTYAWTVPAGAIITAGQGTNQITVTFAGTGGNVSVTETNTCGSGTAVNFAVAITPLPVTSAITGTTPVCLNSTGVVYSVTNVAGDTYNWTVPAGATITAGQGTNQITVNWGVTSGNVTVVQTNICGPGPAVILPVTVTQLPVTSAITGTTPVCPTAAGVIYSVTNVVGNTYNWTVPAGATITSGQGTNQITVTFAGTGGTVFVIETNNCGPGVAVNFAVAIFPLPVTSAITGVTPVCPTQTGVVYSVTNVAADTYNWTVPAGATITAGQGTNQITVNWGGIGGNVSVTQTNICGPGVAVNFAVAITPLPVTSAITGTTPVCPNTTGVIYSVTNVVGDTYNWTVPAGATITSGQGTNQITVNFGATGGTISVIETNICGPGPAVNFALVVTPIPVTSVITGPSPVCANSTAIVYSVTNVAGNTYNWSVTGSGVITSGQGTNQVTINWGATGGTVSVIESNVCGIGAAVNLPVAITLLPVTSAITGTSSVCSNSTGLTFSVINSAGSTYAWTVSAGATITAGQGTNQITVNWGSSGGNVSVTETASCGVGATVNFPVSIFPLPVTSAITGTTPVCPNATGIIYSVTNVAGDTYAWTVPAGATITAGQGTNQITVNWGVTGGTVSVIQTNMCGPGPAVNFAVAISSLPATSAITGTTPVCLNSTGVIYSVTNTIGNTYAWTVPAGATITAGQGTNQITVNFGATSGTVSVIESNNCGPGTAVNFAVAVTQLPVTSIITGTTPVCPNATGVIYSVTNTVGNTYAWTVPAGAVITSGQGTNQITVTFAGTAGNVSVIESNNCGPGTAVIFAVAISPLPVTSTITGTTPVCPTASGIIYSVTNVAGNTYNWTVPAGAIITAGQGTNQITVTFAGTGGNVSVVETNNCGPGTTVNFAVAITPIPVTSAIVGPSPVCLNATGIVYSVTNVVGSSYAWTVPAGATITAGQGTNQITVDFGITTGTISVIESNVCGSGAAVNLALGITVLPITSAITGTSPVCPNATGIIFSVINSTGSTYAWTAPVGATITSGQGSNQITVDFGATAGTISVAETASCGVGATVNFAVSSITAPATSAIAGATPVCPNATGVIYSVTNNAGNTYAWTVPVGANITSGQGTNQITIDFGATAGNVSVTETNICGANTVVNLPIVISTLPVTSVITGTTPVCPTASGIIYSVTNVAGDTYNWTVPAGAIITAGQGTNQITVTFAGTGGNVSVVETNNCGPGTTVNFAVAITPIPVTSAIVGPSPVCLNATGIVYSVTNVVGSSYAWTVPAGATITAGQGTNQITVDFGITAGTISVIESNVCGSGAAVNLALGITVLPVTSPITGTALVCPNATGITFSVINTTGSTYAWTAPFGATITSGQGTNQITVDFGATAGTISVTETASCGVGVAINFVVTFINAPATSAITGTSPVCPNATGLAYSVTNNTGNTYAWIVPAGATITAGQGTNQLTVDFGATAGNVSVTETNICGASTVVNLPIVISSLPATLVITGTTPVCPTATGVVFSVINTVGDTYTWTVPAGATITSGQGTNQITVDFGGTAGNVSVIETNNCGPGTQVDFAVAIFPLPVTSAITGTTPVCPNATGVIYSVTNTIGNTYAWAVPAGATITSGQGTNQVTVDLGVTAGNVSVIETNNCGPGTQVNFAVAISSLPATSAITGTTPVCLNSTGITYSVTNVVGDTYNWTVPAGAIITAGQGTNQITVDFGTTGGTVSVIETNNCGPGTAVNFNVTVTQLPVTSAITGTTPVCPNATGIIYSVTNTVGSTYAWTVPAGAAITAGQGTNQITVTFGAAGAGAISVTETGTCGAGAGVTYNVVISAPTAPIVISPLTYCQNDVAPALTAIGVSLLWYTNASGGIGNAAAPIPSTSVAGTIDYYVTQTSAGCESPRADITVVVNPLPSVTVSSPTICAGSSATITAGGATSYTWSAGATSTGLTIATASPVVTTTYTVTGTSLGCSATAVSTVTVNNLPFVILNSLSICTGQSATLIAIGNLATYNWSTGVITDSITVSPMTTTSYTVTGTTLGCSSSAVATVTVNSIPVVTVNSQTVCAGTSVILTATGANSYLWNNGSNSNTIVVTPDATTTYTATGTTTGCSSTGAGTVTVNVMPVAEFTAPLTTSILYPVVNFTNTSTDATLWNWDFGDNFNASTNTSTIKNPTHEYSQIGSYCVLLTVSNANCIDTTNHCISIEGVFTFYVPNSFSPNGDGLNDEFFGVGEGITEYEMTIFDRWGNQVFYGDDISKHWNGTYMGSIVQEDVYVYLINLTDNHNEGHKYMGSVTIVK